MKNLRLPVQSFLIFFAGILASPIQANENCIPAIIQVSTLYSGRLTEVSAALQSQGVQIVGVGTANLMAVATQEAKNAAVTKAGFAHLATEPTPEILVHAHIPHEALPLLAQMPEVSTVEFGRATHGTLWPEEIEEFKTYVLPKLAELISEFMPSPISIEQLIDLNPNSDIARKHAELAMSSVSAEARARNYEFKLAGAIKVVAVNAQGVSLGYVHAFAYLFIVMDDENNQHRWELRIQPFENPNTLISKPGEWISN